MEYPPKMVVIIVENPLKIWLIWGFPEMAGAQNGWFISWKMDDDWGYPHFRKLQIDDMDNQMKPPIFGGNLKIFKLPFNCMSG